MYSPTMRLLAVLELLQARQQISGAELAQRLEVDQRTVRRYIQQLQDMGIPVEAERGIYGAYQLKPAQRVPPLLFTESETLALTLGLLTIRELQFPVDRAIVETTLAKIERVLPAHLIQHARAIQSAISIQHDFHRQRIEPAWLMQLSLAALHQQQVQLEYSSYSEQLSTRSIDPYGIVFNEGAWYMVGYCHLRSAMRIFRLDRIRGLTPLTTNFMRPASINIVDTLLAGLNAAHDQQQVEVLLKTSLDHAQQLIAPQIATLEATAQCVLLRRAAVHLEWVAFLLLELDVPLVVLQPPALRSLIQRMATKALAMLEPLEPIDL
ncbi:helix-turn-helix transcriptional regulator [Herpetosiphon giganteus]|uniref:helix-turn-helix transcriptional regulator n=1 Tax=Herpetosiphon giganteus TaxID=2029754 RepID=UPI00195A487F|nr:YafY family protein [Herpetosiphon giganteus]MBM7844625.1 putative DNA-binding transcriptional regulator YafY [Herpetosiphon giganteus]